MKIFYLNLFRTHPQSEEFNLRAKGFGWIPGEHFYTMAIGFRDAYQSDNQERSITAYKNHLGMIYPTYKAVCIGNILYLLLETKDLESVANNLDNFFQTYHLTGCSHHFSNIIEFSASVEQSLEILRIGMKQNPRQNIYRFQEYNMPYLVSTLKKNIVSRTISAFQKYSDYKYMIKNSEPII